MNLKIIKKYLGRLIFSVFMVYSLNIILVKYNIILPINVFSIIIYTLFGAPGVIVFVFFAIRYR